jgi:hypothetical protein
MGAAQPRARPVRAINCTSWRLLLKELGYRCPRAGKSSENNYYDRQKPLKRRLGAAHGLTPDQYRKLFDLKPDYPMVAPSYRPAAE